MSSEKWTMGNLVHYSLPLDLSTWGRVQHELLYVTWGVMEMALLTPLALAIMTWARYWPPGQVLLWLLLLMMVAFNLARLMTALAIPAEHQRSIMAVALLLTLFLSIRTLVHNPASLFDLSWIGQFVSDVAESGNLRWAQDVSLFGLIIIAWWRGLRLVNRNFDINGMGLRLRVGALILAPFLVWLGNLRLLWDVTPFLLLYFLAALTAVALIRAEELQQERTGQSASLNPRWLTIIFIAGTLTIFSAGLLAIVISGESAGTIVGWLAPLVVALQMIATVAFSTLLFVAIPALELLDVAILGTSSLLNRIIVTAQAWLATLRKVAGKVTDAGAATAQGGGETAADAPLLPEGLLGNGFALGDLSSVSNILLILLMVAVVLFIAMMFSGFYRRTTIAERESGRLRREDEEEKGLGRRLLRRFGFLRDWRAAASIRRVYRHMLQAADACGYPRLETETPYEYLDTLARAWPLHKEETALITQAYVNVRYGELPETEEELNAIMEAWQRLERNKPETAVQAEEA